MYIHTELRGFLPADLEDPFLNLLSLSRQYLYLWNPKKHHKHLEPSVRLTWTPATRSSQRLSKYTRYTRESPSQLDLCSRCQGQGTMFSPGLFTWCNSISNSVTCMTLQQCNPRSANIFGWFRCVKRNTANNISNSGNFSEASEEGLWGTCAERWSTGSNYQSKGVCNPLWLQLKHLGSMKCQSPAAKICVLHFIIFIWFICQWLLLHICCEWDARWCK